VVRCLRPAAEPTFRLFCFPYLGGTSDPFSAWVELLPEHVELYAVELPSLGGPHDAELRLPFEEFTAWLRTQFLPLLDRPFAFYGHSAGGWCALEVARGLSDDPVTTPAFIGVGALTTPELTAEFRPGPADRPEAISDEPVFRAARVLSVPRPLLDDPVQGPRALETIRRDLWLISRMGPERMHVASASPLILLAGSKDPLATIDKDVHAYLNGQSSHELHTVEGGHLFIDEPAGCVAAVRVLLSHIPPPEPRQWDASILSSTGANHG
jgi:surfactin synthase thioesterase subunit